MEKETTNTQDTYEKLARQLDQFIVGVPFSPTLIEILKILYPDDEVDMALKMSFENKTAAQLAGETGEDETTVRERLGRMARRGTVYTAKQPERERTYRLLPSMVGFSDAPFFAGKDTETTRALAPLWVKYSKEEFGDELERGMPLLRVIPIAESLKDASEILPFDAIKDRLDGVEFMAVAHCACRQMRRYIGEGCDHSLETCLHFDGMGRYVVEQGMGRQVDRDEVLKILEEATGEGLVHVCDNIDGRLSTICSCCSCCCVFLHTKKAYGRDNLARSNYVVSIEVEDCAGCGTCEERCPMGATAVGEDKVAIVDGATCIGCGVCVPSCSTGAAGLVLREGAAPPPDAVQLVTARIKK